MGRRKQISLVVTHACNLQCSYCYETNKSRLHMPPEVAKKAIREAFCGLGEDDELEIDFFGGEPFLRFHLIRNIFEWVVGELKPTSPYVFFATTNGTLIHREIKHWLCKHSGKFYCCLSIDGTKAMHDANRSSSFDRIDVDFFAETWPDQPVKMTVSTETLGHLADGVLYLQSRGLKVECNLAESIDWSNERTLPTLHEQLAKLADHFLHNGSEMVPKILDIDFEAVDGSQVLAKWCGAGEDTMCVIDVDGGKYPCQMFAPISAGKLARQKGQIELSDATLHDETCAECVLGRICGTCYGANFLSTGDPARRNRDMCKVMRIRALVAAHFQAKRMERSLECETLTEEDARSIFRRTDGIKKVLAASEGWNDLPL